MQVFTKSAGKLFKLQEPVFFAIVPSIGEISLNYNDIKGKIEIDTVMGLVISTITTD